MSPIVALIIGKILSYLSENADEIIAAIRERFTEVQSEPEISTAIQELGFEPTEEKLTRLSDLLKAKGQSPDELAKLLVNRTTVV